MTRTEEGRLTTGRTCFLVIVILFAVALIFTSYSPTTPSTVLRRPAGEEIIDVSTLAQGAAAQEVRRVADSLEQLSASVGKLSAVQDVRNPGANQTEIDGVECTCGTGLREQLFRLGVGNARQTVGDPGRPDGVRVGPTLSRLLVLQQAEQRRRQLEQLLRSARTQGTCSSDRAQRRQHQRVIAYSLFGDPSQPLVLRRYFSQLWDRIQEAARLYPGWRVRVYYDPAVTGHPAVSGLLDYIRCCTQQADLCDVTRLPGSPTVADLRSLQPIGTLWRFLAMLDPTVDLALLRDVDSYLSDREVSAVSEFLSSNRTFHIMRDHPHHNYQILAGLWGVDLTRKRDLVAELIGDTLARPSRDMYDFDQILLSKIVWPKAKCDAMIHDSYFCGNPNLRVASGGVWRPFPTRRQGQDYTGRGPGKEEEAAAVERCPRVCRPPKHQDWSMC